MGLLALALLPLAWQTPDPPTDQGPRDLLIATVPVEFALEQPLALMNGSKGSQALPLSWSPDGTRVAYYGFKKDTLYALLNAEPTGETADLANAPVFSADGQHVVWSHGRSKRNDREEWRLLVDDHLLAKLDWAGLPSISADGGLIGYWTQPGYRSEVSDFSDAQRMVLVLAVRKGKRYKSLESKAYSWGLGLGAPQLIEASQRAAAPIFDGSSWRTLVVGGKRDEFLGAPRANLIDQVVFGDGPSIATVVWEATKQPSPDAPEGARVFALYRDDRRIETEADALGHPAFTPDSEHLAFVYVRGALFGVGIDNRLLPGGKDPITRVLPAPDGERLAWVLHPGGELQAFARLIPAAEQLVLRGKAQVALATVSKPEEVHSGPAFDQIGELCFSPDGEHLAYSARTAKGWFVQLGELQAGPFEAVSALRWQDPRRVHFGTRSGRELWWRCLAVADD